MIMFIVAGVTDMIDGTLARNIKGGSRKMGAELDSYADMYMVLVSVFVIMPRMQFLDWHFWGVLAALVSKLLSAVPALLKHHRMFLLHTISNKVLALLLFATPVLYYFVFGSGFVMNTYLSVLIFLVIAVSVEEWVIISLLNHPSSKIKGFWQIKQINDEFLRMQSEQKVE